MKTGQRTELKLQVITSEVYKQFKKDPEISLQEATSLSKDIADKDNNLPTREAKQWRKLFKRLIKLV